MAAIERFGEQTLAAWKGELGFNDLLTTASALEDEGAAPLSVILYQTWLAHNVSPYIHAAYFNLGATLSHVGDFAGAEAAYRQAIAIAPQFLQPRLNLGLLLERQGQTDAALAQWEWIARNGEREGLGRSAVIAALNHIGRVLEPQREVARALDAFNQSLELEPDQPDVLHHWVFLRQRQCIWPVYEDVYGVSVEAMRAATSALAMLNISDDPESQLSAARRFVQRKLALDLPCLSEGARYRHDRIRIGYSSSDFTLHPVSMLTVQLYELHDRSKFEVYAYCWSPEDGSGLRQRVVAAMDHFHRIDTMSDEEAARLIRSHEIDILIDLQGQTAGARPNILQYRPAPIQITYLGLPATTGIPAIDYVIADRFLIPEEYAQYYSERPLYMPDVYQISDRNRSARLGLTREQCGLPGDSFVFCSLNNTFKITPEMFAVWMRILHRVPGSVLWLLADNPPAKANLLAQAQRHGIAPERLVFALRVLPEDYLGQYPCADLFLDTFPFNAGTTANDCLWMGCPLLTRSGRSFASRMAGALLTAAGLSDMITYDVQHYEEAAVAFANDPALREQIRQKLRLARESGPLFDTLRFVRNLEAQFLQWVPIAQPMTEEAAAG
ncbi:tetratricopeptide repeat protein [Candidatus Symbiobacter mobilis]|uniref:protein O-GlcNAc transferase n=1 Tax=Candidatus Symbiobacter mobilis CR TaxID=946483 RepID=U5NAI6_9BURK|nr:tetratricopeptide repeat protein [Candidatus Symbiobacter mobilis]AGX87273.1 O-linked N-acetylglucosamine transferase-like protein [Candidatus Symbiobacter mobilis CR]